MRSRFFTFELTHNINTILYGCTLSNLEINMLTACTNVNFIKMLETLNFSAVVCTVFIHNVFNTHPLTNYQKRVQLRSTLFLV